MSTLAADSHFLFTTSLQRLERLNIQFLILPFSSLQLSSKQILRQRFGQKENNLEGHVIEKPVKGAIIMETTSDQTLWGPREIVEKSSQNYPVKGEKAGDSCITTLFLFLFFLLIQLSISLKQTIQPDCTMSNWTCRHRFKKSS